jgi:hypothetical protein
MSGTAEAIIAELKRVFPASLERLPSPLINSDQGDEPFDVAAAFSDKSDWTKLEASWLDTVPKGLGSALSFLSDEAICFFIPAFVVADLEGRLERVNPLFHLTHGFDDFSRDRQIRSRKAETWTEYGKLRWSRLTNDQALAIVHYLEWVIERDGLDRAYSAAEALKFYWYQRIAD